MPMPACECFDEELYVSDNTHKVIPTFVITTGKFKVVHTVSRIIWQYHDASFGSSFSWPTPYAFNQFNMMWLTVPPMQWSTMGSLYSPSSPHSVEQTVCYNAFELKRHSLPSDKNWANSVHCTNYLLQHPETTYKCSSSASATLSLSSVHCK